MRDGPSTSRLADLIPRPVWLLGWASLFTDAATEMIYPLLPVYLSRVLGRERDVARHDRGRGRGHQQPAEDRLRLAVGSPRETAAAGDRRLCAVVGGAAAHRDDDDLAASAGRFARSTAPAKASAARRATRCWRASPTPSSRGRIFGFHRAMDHTGAIVGPLVATVFLFFLPGDIPDAVCADGDPGRAGRGHAVPASDEPGPRRSDCERRTNDPNVPERSERLPTRTLRRARRSFCSSAWAIPPTLFCCCDCPTRSGRRRIVPLLWAALHVVKASLSTWGGGLSDRIGRRSHRASAGRSTRSSTSALRLVSSAAAFVALFLVYGVYFALAEGAEKALVADLTPAQHARHRRSASTTPRSASARWSRASASASSTSASAQPPPSSTGAALAATAAAVLLLLPIRTRPRNVTDAGPAKIDGSHAPNSRDQ